MKSAYLYVRVSTDEQKRKGYSLPEQEDRLLKYCEYNNIQVKSVFREDFSAKNFNRPEWNKLVATIKRRSIKEANDILFVKWDRFSRNIEYAYEMIGILRKYNSTAMAIDQPIDFEIPESTVMLAVYLAVPEAENTRRSLNTSNGMRRAKLLGRHPNKAPLGYLNITGADGKKQIVPHSFTSELIKWAFEQLSKNAYSMEEVRRMVNVKGLNCARSHFWKLLHNPVYCGYVSFLLKEDGRRQFVRGIHEPLISEELFNEVQSIIGSKRKFTGKIAECNDQFILRKYLTCPACGRNLTASFSTGRRGHRYAYYHCTKGCKVRFRAEVINDGYENKLSKFRLTPAVADLFNLILEDVNVNTIRDDHLREKKLIEKKVADQELYISKARKLFVLNKIDYDDFGNIRKEHQELLGDLNDELAKVIFKIRCIDKQLITVSKSSVKIFDTFENLDINDKKLIVDRIPPSKLDAKGFVSVRPVGALSKILVIKI